MKNFEGLNSICSSKKTIMFVVTTPFAANAFLFLHIKELATKYNVVLCTNLKLAKLKPELEKIIEVYDVPLAREISILSDFKALIKLIIIFRDLRPALIHSLTPKAGLLSMVGGVCARIPLRCHTFTGQIWANRTGVSRFFLKLMDKILVSCSTIVFADSPSQAKFLIKENIVKPTQIKVLGPGSITGVDLNRFKKSVIKRKTKRNELDVNRKVCVFLFVGRINSEKGLFDLFHAFHNLVQKKLCVQLWIVGPDEKGLYDQLNQLVSSCSPQIKWLGENAEPENIMAGADVLVLPSYREGFGSVLIEAAACGIPAIAYRIDGVIDAVVENKTGLLVEKGSVKQLTKAMEQLQTDVSLRKQLGENAKNRAVSEFDSKKIIQKLFDYYLVHLG